MDAKSAYDEVKSRRQHPEVADLAGATVCGSTVFGTSDRVTGFVVVSLTVFVCSRSSPPHTICRNHFSLFTSTAPSSSTHTSPSRVENAKAITMI